MMIKIVSLGMVVLAMFGRLRVPGAKRLKRLSTSKCPACGRFRIGSETCPCGDGKRG